MFAYLFYQIMLILFEEMLILEKIKVKKSKLFPTDNAYYIVGICI